MMDLRKAGPWFRSHSPSVKASFQMGASGNVPVVLHEVHGLGHGPRHLRAGFIAAAAEVAGIEHEDGLVGGLAEAVDDPGALRQPTCRVRSAAAGVEIAVGVTRVEDHELVGHAPATGEEEEGEPRCRA